MLLLLFALLSTLSLFFLLYFSPLLLRLLDSLLSTILSFACEFCGALLTSFTNGRYYSSSNGSTPRPWVLHRLQPSLGYALPCPAFSLSFSVSLNIYGRPFFLSFLFIYFEGTVRLKWASGYSYGVCCGREMGCGCRNSCSVALVVSDTTVGIIFLSFKLRRCGLLAFKVTNLNPVKEKLILCVLENMKPTFSVGFEFDDRHSFFFFLFSFFFFLLLNGYQKWEAFVVAFIFKD